MTRVEIEYCTSSGFLDRAETIEHAALVMFGDELEAVTIVPTQNGGFRVSVDDRTVFDDREERFDVDEVIRRIRMAV